MSIEIHDTNVYTDISLVLLDSLDSSFNLDMIDKNSLLFFRRPDNCLLKKTNIKGFQYCIISDETAINDIQFDFIIVSNLVSGNGEKTTENIKDIQTYIYKEKYLECKICLNKVSSLCICPSQMCSYKQNLQKITVKIESTTNLNVEKQYSKIDKFQDSMLKSSFAIGFAAKRENYKKHMKQISSVKSNTSTGSSEIISKNIKICKAITKKGTKCSNKCIKNSDYCGIVSHIGL